MYVNVYLDKKITLIVIFFISVLNSFCQDLNSDFLKKNSVTLTTIDFDSKNNSDLEKIVSVIGDKKIVLIGEHFHSDGKTLMMKSRLIKFLHEKQGFNVFLYELPYLDIHRINTLCKTEEEFLIAIGANFQHSISTNQIDFFKYLYKSRTSNNPLYFEGIDIGAVSTLRGSTKKLDSILNSIDNNKTIKPKWEKLVKVMTVFYKFNYYQDFFLNAQSLVDSLKMEINQIEIDKRSKERIILGLDNIIFDMDWYAHRSVEANEDKNVFDTHNNIRDKHMAENVIRMYEEIYPDEKMIISVSNYHASRSLNGISRSIKAVTMTDYLYEKYNNELYSIVTTSYDGRTGDSIKNSTTLYTDKRGYVINKGNKYIQYPKMKEKSFESLLKNNQYNYAFFDFSPLRKQSSLDEIYMFPLGYKPIKTNWSNIFDGVVFINRMEIDISYRTDDWLKSMSYDQISEFANIYMFGNKYPPKPQSLLNE
jgi:erythromycin esterase-like protein